MAPHLAWCRTASGTPARCRFGADRAGVLSRRRVLVPSPRAPAEDAGRNATTPVEEARGRCPRAGAVRAPCMRANPDHLHRARCAAPRYNMAGPGPARHCDISTPDQAVYPLHVSSQDGDCRTAFFNRATDTSAPAVTCQVKLFDRLFDKHPEAANSGASNFRRRRFLSCVARRFAGLMEEAPHVGLGTMFLEQGTQPEGAGPDPGGCQATRLCSSPGDRTAYSHHDADPRISLSAARLRNKSPPSLISSAQDKNNRPTSSEIRNVQQHEDCSRGSPRCRRRFHGYGERCRDRPEFRSERAGMGRDSGPET